jgi:signal transduction histidine kinase
MPIEAPHRPDSLRDAEPSVRARRLRFALLYSAGWSPFLALSVGGAIVAQRMGQHERFGTAIGSALLAALIGLPVWVLTGRAQGWSTNRAVAAYAGAGIAYGAVFGLGMQLLGAIDWAHGVVRPLTRVDMSASPGGFLVFVLMLFAMLAARSVVRAERSARAASVAEAGRNRAELQALRAHLDPHFLFNTLNAIAAVVETDATQARQMLVRTAALLRRLLDRAAPTRDIATVADEWEIVSEYLALERLRMGDRLRVEVSISDDALECDVPAVLLQPLVENAIRHGLFPLPGGGTLRVGGEVRDGMLRIDVSDTGMGATLNAVERADGYGLRVTRQRIAGMYHGAGQMEIRTSPGNGFTVVLTLPTEVPDAMITPQHTGGTHRG